MKRLVTLCLGVALLLNAGCSQSIICPFIPVPGSGTFTQGYMRQGPAMFGGVRLDLAILMDDHVGALSKVVAGFDFLPSLCFDLVLLPLFSVWNELYENIYYDGIQVRPPVHWDNPPPKYAPYSAKSDELVPGRSTRPTEVEGIGLR